MGVGTWKRVPRWYGTRGYLMSDIGWAPGDGTLIEAFATTRSSHRTAKYMHPFRTCGYSHSGLYSARVPFPLSSSTHPSRTACVATDRRIRIAARLRNWRNERRTGVPAKLALLRSGIVRGPFGAGCARQLFTGEFTDAHRPVRNVYKKKIATPIFVVRWNVGMGTRTTEAALENVLVIGRW